VRTIRFFSSLPMTLRSAILPAAFAVLGYANTAYASNWSFLRNSAVAQFDDEDVRLMMESANTVISDPNGPARRQWRNERTGHSGELQSTAAFAGPNDLRCKRLLIVNRAGSKASRSTYTLCDMPPEGWRLVPADFAPSPAR
jgi:hypothetical protein